MNSGNVKIKAKNWREWAEIRTEEVLNIAENFADKRAVTFEQRRILQTALEGLRVQAVEWLPPDAEKFRPVMPPFVHLPILVCAGICGAESVEAQKLSAATSLLFLGIDVFDDVADGDCPAHWKDYGAAERNLVAATLLCSLPQMIISEIAAKPETILAIQKTLGSGLLEMGAGQQSDLRNANQDSLTIESVIASVESKSGAEVEMFARMAAQLAEADEKIVEFYAEFARAIGTAGQISSDCYELFNDPACRDLAHGARTLPVVWYLSRLSGGEKTDFLDLLGSARNDAAARGDVREILRKSGVLRGCAIVVETFCQKARRALEQANPRDSARDGLRAMIEDVTFFPSQRK